MFLKEILMEIKSATYKNGRFRWAEYHSSYDGYGDMIVDWTLIQFTIYILVKLLFSALMLTAIVIVGLGVIFSFFNIF